MDKVSELKTIKKIVELILKVTPETRDNDELLYLNVVIMVNPSAVFMPFHEVMSMRKSLNLPAFETVRRARQKAQSQYPELAGSTACKEARTKLEDDYREFALE